VVTTVNAGKVNEATIKNSHYTEQPIIFPGKEDPTTFKLINNKLQFSSRFIYAVGAFHKRRPHKIAKNRPPCPHGSISPCSRGHNKFRKIRSYLRQKVRMSASEDPSPRCPQNVTTGYLLLWPRTSFMDSPLLRT